MNSLISNVCKPFRLQPLHPIYCRDTAGQERFRTITTAYYRGAMGIMLVYDITDEKSFENIKNWIRNIEENASSDVEKMLLGNKCELNEKRQVTRNANLCIFEKVRFRWGRAIEGKGRPNIEFSQIHMSRYVCVHQK